jgi:hypothetical protein
MPRHKKSATPTLPFPAEDLAPFALTCGSCDAGMGIRRQAEAIALGWTDVELDPVGQEMSWTHLGLCPECQKEK